MLLLLSGMNAFNMSVLHVHSEAPCFHSLTFYKRDNFCWKEKLFAFAVPNQLLVLTVFKVSAVPGLRETVDGNQMWR